MKGKTRLRKLTSVFCALAILLGMLPVSGMRYVSAGTDAKYVSEEVMLSNDAGGYESRNLKAFMKEDFDGYEDSVSGVFGTSFITKYSAAYSGTEPVLVDTNVTGGLNSGKAMKITGTAGAWTDQTNSITIDPAYWADGNKVTELSFDVQGVGGTQVPIWFIWARGLDDSGRNSGASLTSDTGGTAVLGQGFLACGNGVSNKATAIQYDGTYTGATKPVKQPVSNYKIFGDESNDATKNLVGADYNLAGVNAHYKITISYAETSTTTLTATTKVEAYPYAADGNYTTALGSYTDTITFTCEDVDSLTLVPMIQAVINKRGGTIDNLQVESVDSQAITYVSAYKDVFATDSAATETDWKNAAAAYNALSALVQKRLAYYGTAITEHYASAEKIVTSDFDDPFTDSMFWSNYDNLVINDGKVTGARETTKRSVADGLLVKNKALSVVYLKGVEASAGGLYSGAGCAALYPLVSAGNKSCHITNYLEFGNSKYTMRFEGVGNSYEPSANMYRASGSIQAILETDSANITDMNIAMFYDWSKYNAADGYEITIIYVYDYNLSGEKKSNTATVKYRLGTLTSAKEQDYQTYFGTDIPKPEDFRFAFRNLGALDAVTVATVDESAGAVQRTGMYFKNESGALGTDANNGAMVFTMLSDDIVTTLDDFTGVEVTDYGTLFINRATLAENNNDIAEESYSDKNDYHRALSERLTLTTAKVKNISKAQIGTITDNHYNVRINGTQTDGWAGNIIFARTYVTYKVGTSTITIYGDAMFKSNMGNLKEAVARHGLTKGSTFADTLTTYSTHLFSGACTH